MDGVGPWNVFSQETAGTVAAIFNSIDHAQAYSNAVRTLAISRLEESERRVSEIESSLKQLRATARFNASTSITIRGGDTGWVESNPDYYADTGTLQLVPNENIFRLRDTGHFSSIRSLGGFAGKAVIEHSLGSLVYTGEIDAISDGSNTTFWSTAHFTPAPVRANRLDVPWLPLGYTHGSAVMVTYHMDRPTLASEVFIDPVATEPFILTSISWRPTDLASVFGASGYFENGTDAAWSLSGSSFFWTDAGVGSTNALVVPSPSGYASWTFDIDQVLAASISGITQPTVQDPTGVRVELIYAYRAIGSSLAGARISWLNSTGAEIAHILEENYPSAFFSSNRLTTFIPAGAASGVVRLGVFTGLTDPASAIFDNVSLYVGEQSWDTNIEIKGPTTITLRQIALSGRYSFVFAQTHPRREVLVKEPDGPPVKSPLALHPDIDPGLKRAVQSSLDRGSFKGTGEYIFAYRIGFKELDLRYREHVPRGSLVSLPMRTAGEIRRIWVSTELGKHHTEGMRFYVYPLANDIDRKVEIAPFRSGDLDSAGGNSNISEGQILHVYTPEELDEGWSKPSDQVVRADPRQEIEVFDGTDRNGRVDLNNSPHVRLPSLYSPTTGIQAWLEEHSIYPTSFDPNAATLYGLTETSRALIDSLRERQAALPTIARDDLETRAGYLPVKISIFTDRWTAHPDTLGRPDRTPVRAVVGEVLQATTFVETSTETVEQVIGFDQWLASTTLQEYGLLARTAAAKKIVAREQFTQDLTLTRVFEINPAFKRIILSYVRADYARLKAGGQLGKDQQTVSTNTSAVERDNTYRTKNSPIITGPSGTGVKVYIRNATTGVILPLAQTDVVVEAEKGLVHLKKELPTGYTEVLASYQYVTSNGTEDFFSSTIGFITEGASGGLIEIAGDLGLRTRTLPITRNMTDYIGGRIPDMRFPNLDRLSKDYYPVIEYYITPTGQIQFARDFWKHGDLPARIEVETETLAIEPRVEVNASRSGSPSATPQVRFVSLHVREGAPASSREVFQT